MYHDDDESPSDSLTRLDDHSTRHRIIAMPGVTWDTISNLEYKVQQLLETSNTEITVLFKRLHDDAKLPSKSGELEACYDISCVPDDEFYGPSYHPYGWGDSDPPVRECLLILGPRQSHVFRTGLACAIPDGYALFLWDRSGLAAKHGIHRLAGVIDCTYRGEILVVLTNLSDEECYVRPGDRIVQAHLTRVLPSRVAWADELPDSYRQGAGFGSTGK